MPGQAYGIISTATPCSVELLEGIAKTPFRIIQAAQDNSTRRNLLYGSLVAFCSSLGATGGKAQQEHIATAAPQ